MVNSKWFRQFVDRFLACIRTIHESHETHEIARSEANGPQSCTMASDLSSQRQRLRSPERYTPPNQLSMPFKKTKSPSPLSTALPRSVISIVVSGDGLSPL